MLGQRSLAGNGSLRDRCSRIARCDFVAQPLRFFTAMRVFEKEVNVHQARSGNDAFIADMSEANEQVAKQFDFQFVPWSEVAVSAFTGEDVLLLSIPNEASFAETGSGRDHGLIAHKILLAVM